MKRVILASAVLVFFSLSLLLVQIVSCTKVKAELQCPTPVYPISGIWVGTYQTDQVSHPPTYSAFSIFPDGTILRRAKVVGSADEYAYNKGTWTLTGNTLKFRDTTLIFSAGMVIQEGTLQFDDSGVLTNGVWKDVSDRGYSGTFQTMNRVN